jgi:hypothetical protein
MILIHIIMMISILISHNNVSSLICCFPVEFMTSLRIPSCHSATFPPKCCSLSFCVPFMFGSFISNVARSFVSRCYGSYEYDLCLSYHCLFPVCCGGMPNDILQLHVCYSVSRACATYMCWNIMLFERILYEFGNMNTPK